MRKLRVELTGVTPLLMHNVRLANPTDSIVREIAAINSKRVKTDADQLRRARLEWEGGLYFDAQAGPYVPGGNLEACLRDAAKATNSSKKVIRAVIVHDHVNPVVYDGPRDPDGLWGDGPGVSRFIHQSMATVQRSKVLRTWPRFDGWSLDFVVLLNEEALDYSTLVEIVGQAGMTTGLGDYRPTFGRFEASVSDL